MFNSGKLGPGQLRLRWDGVSGRPGLGAPLLLNGTLIADGYRPGDLAVISATITVINVPGCAYCYVGRSTPVMEVMGYPELNYGGPPDQRPARGYNGNISAEYNLSAGEVERLETLRAGKGFDLQVDAEVLYIPAAGASPGPAWQPHPKVQWQQNLQVKEEQWGQVLAQWGYGLAVPLVLALPELIQGPDQAETLRLLRLSLAKLNDGDYSGSITSARMALELLRQMVKPAPAAKKSAQDLEARTYGVIDALFTLASAAVHADGATRGFLPGRSDALGVLSGATAFARIVFEAS